MHASQVCWQGEGPTTLPGSPWTGIAPNHFELLQLLFARAYKMMQTSTGGRVLANLTWTICGGPPGSRYPRFLMISLISL
ncbi:hypothetical protein AB1N83_006517 [Pleurotus pulmonarius]